jgi:multisubunit Na+/H+ antiporter MnhG subunit
MRLMLATLLAGLGASLWLWGALCLTGKKSYLWKIHALGISDMIGSLFILAGVLLHSTEYWPHVLLAMASIAFWGTAFSLVMARLGDGRNAEKQE